MDGIHDLGGMHGFGQEPASPDDVEPKSPFAQAARDE